MTSCMYTSGGMLHVTHIDLKTGKATATCDCGVIKNAPQKDLIILTTKDSTQKEKPCQSSACHKAI